MGNQQSTRRVGRAAIVGTVVAGPIGGLVVASVAGVQEIIRAPLDKSSKVIPTLTSHGASSEMKQMVSDKLFYGESEFECKIEQPTYEKVRYNNGYLHYERFHR